MNGRAPRVFTIIIDDDTHSQTSTHDPVGTSRALSPSHFHLAIDASAHANDGSTCHGMAGELYISTGAHAGCLPYY